MLANRHIKVPPHCPICPDGADDIRHLLFTCRRARLVWKAFGIMDRIDQALQVDRSGSVVLEEMLRWPRQNSPLLGHLGLQETVAVGAWYIWWERREAMKGVKVKPPMNSAFSIHAIASNYAGQLTDGSMDVVRWTKPPAGTYKVNTDAAYFEDGSGAIVAIIRDSRGQAVAGTAECFYQVQDAASAEALALRRGLQLVQERGCTRVAMESDCLEIIDACNGEKEIRAPYSAILADCFQFAHEVPSLSFMHCPREANNLAHLLARHAYDSKLFLFWEDEPPDFLLSHVIKDVNLSILQ